MSPVPAKLRLLFDRPPSAIDISALTFEEWVRFVFDHLVAELQWYWDAEWEYQIRDEPRVLEYMTRLFRWPIFLLEHYSEDQLDQGFWFLIGPQGCMEILWNEEIPIRLRKGCIQAMGDLFKEFFSQNPLRTAPRMWWDLLTEGYRLCDSFAVEGDDELVREAIFEELCRSLNLGIEHCVVSALDGLGHLKHPEARKVIDEFLGNHPEISPTLRKYALECREGRNE